MKAKNNRTITFSHPTDSADLSSAFKEACARPILNTWRRVFNEAASYAQHYGHNRAVDWAERFSGREALLERYTQAVDLIRDKELFVSDACLEALSMRYEFGRGSLNNIPSRGPLLVAANHPYGVVDGLVLTSLLRRARPDFKMVAAKAFVDAPETASWLLPINTSGDKAAERENRTSILGGYRHLLNGGCLGIFPSGKVSRPQGWKGAVEDYPWNEYAARLILNAKDTTEEPAQFVPVHFEGCNSAAYQFAYMIGSTILRRAMIISETLRQQGQTIRVNIGNAVAAKDVPTNPAEATLYLRNATYALGQN